MQSSKAQRIIELQNILDNADQRYYAIGDTRSSKSEIKDEEYDKLRREYEKLMPADRARLDRVGQPFPVDSLFNKVKHKRLVGSIQNCLNAQEFEGWWTAINENQDVQLIATPKLDGLTLELQYVDGNLEVAVTRGNGSVGDDVTANATKIKNLPHKLFEASTLCVRGEVILSRTVFTKINDELIGAGEEPYVNARNAAAGIIGSKHGENCEYFTFVAHGAFNPVNPGCWLSESEKLNALESIGFQVVDRYMCETLDLAVEVYGDFLQDREKSKFEMDGVVFTIESIEQQNALGVSGKKPRYQRAFKFPSQDVMTVLERVDWQAGDGGNLTPVGRVKRVQIAGAMVSNVTLHNYKNIETLDLAIGDTVIMTRSGDTIPFLKEVAQRPPTRVKIAIPKICPNCEKPVTFRKNVDGEDGAFVACENINCPGLQRGMVMRWVKSLEIKGLGDEVLDALIETGAVKTIPDLYALNHEIGELLVNNRRFGDSRAASILSEIDKTRELTIDQFIGSLSINGLGKDRVKIIREKDPQHTLDDIKTWVWTSKNHTESRLFMSAEVLGIPNTAEKFAKAIHARWPVIRKLLQEITIITPLTIEAKSDKLAGKSFCFTTCRPTDEESKKLIELGGIEKSGVSVGLSYLVQKDATKTTSKSAKAVSLRIPVISLDEFRNLLKD